VTSGRRGVSFLARSKRCEKLAFLFSGESLPPREGGRLDLYLEGALTGPRLTGTVKGVDCLYFRPDGRAELHIHAEITTDAGQTIALTAGGVAIPQDGSPVFQLRENVTLMTHHPEHSWVNQLQVWAAGDGRRLEG
jgi:hypothetical protein